MKIISSGKALHSSKFYIQKERRKRFRRMALLFGIVVFIGLIFYVAYHEKLTISEVRIEGETVAREEEIASIAKQELFGRYLWLLPRANALIYPRKTISEILLNKFPRFKSVATALDGFNTLDITVAERPPFALYCREVNIVENMGPCHFTDAEGFIFAEAPIFSSGVYFVYTTSDPILDPIGKKVTTKEVFVMLSEFVEALEELNIYTSALQIGEDEYRLFLPQGGQIIWRSDLNLNMARSNLEPFLSSEVIKAQKDFLERINYLDLRTDNKVFYQFKK